MRVLNETIGIFSVISLFVMAIAMLLVGLIGDGLQFAFEKVRNYELPMQRFVSLLSKFSHHSKPAYY